jgi:hypothetical protein
VELRSFLKGRSAAALVIMPLAVGAAAAALFANTEERPYEASTTVSLGEGLALDPQAFGFGGRVDDFIYTLESSTVTAQVREELGLAADQTGGELSASRIGTGGLIGVSHTADTAEVAAEGLDVGVSTALRALAEQRLGAATDRVEVIDELSAGLSDGLEEIAAAAGGPDVANMYRDATLEIQALQRTIVERDADGTFDPAAAEARIATVTAQRDAIGPLVNEWAQVTARLEQAGLARADAELERLATQRIVTDTANGERFFATEVSRPSVVKVVALPAVAAAVAALGVVLGASLLRDRGRPAPTRPIAAPVQPHDRAKRSGRGEVPVAKPPRARVTSNR